MKTLTIEQAYNAAFHFLESYHLQFTQENKYVDTLVTMLSSMTALSDGYPADRAMIYNWQEAVSQNSRLDSEIIVLAPETAYSILYSFIDNYNKICEEPRPDLTAILKDMKKNNLQNCENIFQKWESSIDYALEDGREYIKLLNR